MLYVVGTPIGNMEDLSPRARDVLSACDLIACEDTRNTKKILERFEISTHAVAIHQHSGDKDLKKIIDELKGGSNIAYVSDAGTPGISDPGGKLVAMAYDAGIDVSPIPGASASITALSASGFPTDSFTFLGFPPHKKGRNTFFAKLDDIDHAVVLYESKHRIIKTLEQLPQERLILVARELTKLHETLYRGLPRDIVEEIKNTSDKGEFTIVIAPKKWTL